MGQMVSFSANGGTASGYQADPALAGTTDKGATDKGTTDKDVTDNGAKGRAGKGVIVLQEYWGLNDHIKDVTDRFAAAGFSAMAPDLYHGKVTKSPDEAGKLLMALNIAQAEKDLRGVVAHLKGLTGKPVGVVGFCMGGALSLFAACKNGNDIGACVIYYGGHPKVEYDFDALIAPVLGHWAEKDDFANQNAAKIEAALKQRGKRYEGHRYPGTRHAFFNDARPEVYDVKAAKESWDRTLAFFDAHL